MTKFATPKKTQRQIYKSQKQMWKQKTKVDIKYLENSDFSKARNSQKKLIQFMKIRLPECKKK